MSPVYVYRPVVTRWPDWCPEGWERAYSDTDDDRTDEPPAGLRELLEAGALPGDLPHHRDEWPDGTVQPEWRIVLLPRRDRVHWLSAPAVHRWVRHARALGAEAHVERGCVANWQVRP